MWRKLGAWLKNIPIKDPIDRQVAPLVQVAEISGIVMTLLTSVVIVARPEPMAQKLALLTVNLVVLAVTVCAWVLLRRGRFMASVLTVTTVVLFSLTVSTLSKGLRSSDSSVLLGFAVPIVMASLLLGRRGLIPVLGLSTLIVVITAVLQSRSVSFVAAAATSADPLIPNTVTFILIFGLLGIFLDRFGLALRAAYGGALERERDLETASASLTVLVTEKTQSLQTALATSEQHAQSLAQAVAELQASQHIVRELSAPILPILQGVLVAPLVGVLDATRAQALTNNLLAAVERQQARYVIFDITGVPVVDLHVAEVLLQTTMAVQLLGAKALLVGVRPEVAQTLIMLGCDLTILRPFPTLQEVVMALLPQTVVAVKPGRTSLFRS